MFKEKWGWLLDSKFKIRLNLWFPQVGVLELILYNFQSNPTPWHQTPVLLVR